MSIVRIAAGANFLEIGLSSGDPPAGDAYLTLKIGSHSFAGENDLWIQEQALRKFCCELTELERSLTGEASLSSVWPKELSLRFFAVTGRGHLAVEGSTGYDVQSENGSWWHSVSFGFEFEFSQLSAALSESWVRERVA